MTDEIQEIEEAFRRLASQYGDPRSAKIVTACFNEVVAVLSSHNEVGNDLKDCESAIQELQGQDGSLSEDESLMLEELLQERLQLQDRNVIHEKRAVPFHSQPQYKDHAPGINDPEYISNAKGKSMLDQWRNKKEIRNIFK